ncbi:hypothetical protein N9Z27_00315 [Alphaproteobacteria bacterium]|nr:hypothetical protein [Alphaproteobacteria bacterium]
MKQTRVMSRDYSLRHYNQTPRRRAEFITPPNLIKQKVGSGGLSDEIIDRAQALLESNTVDFLPLAEIYLNRMMNGIEVARAPSPHDDVEEMISAMLYPAMQLKANGTMFHYPLITTMADKLIQFLEVIREPDKKAVEITLAFHTTMKMVVQGRIQGEGGAHGYGLVRALDEACQKYFEKFSHNIS